MKRTCLRFCALILTMMCVASVYAEKYERVPDFEEDNILYCITSNANKTVDVTFYGTYNPSKCTYYSGDVVIPATVTHDGITYSVTGIGQGAFAACEGITSVTVPEGVTAICSKAFVRCENMEKLTLPSTIKTIGEYAFYYCEKMADFSIPDGVESIGASAFLYCFAISDIVIPNSVQTIGNEAFQCSGITNVEVGSGIKDSPYGLFEQCSRLESVTYSENVETIGFYTFYDSKNVKKLVIRAATPPTTPGININTSTVNLYVPAASIDAYKAAEYWKTFTNIYSLDKLIVTPGDTDGSGTVDVDDAICLAQFLLGNDPEGFDAEAADVNGDGEVNVGDVLALLSLIED